MFDYGFKGLPTRGSDAVRRGLRSGLLAVLVGCTFPAFAGQASLTWDANQDPVAGYFLHYGQASRSYSQKVDVGRATTHTVNPLPNGQTYFFVVTAYDSAGLESAPSNEVRATIAGSAGTQTVLASSANPALAGVTITFTASVTGNAPAGSVAFTRGGAPILGCSATNLAGTGNTRVATCTTSSLNAGTQTILASYQGNASNAASTSNPLTLVVNRNTPRPPAFADIPTTHWAHSEIEALAWNAITLGCSASPALFCPTGTVNRDEMAVFIERTIRGIAFSYQPTGTLFSDVSLAHWAVGPIEQLYADAITLGCASAPLRYCPDREISRAEIVVLLLKARYGASYDPGTVTGMVFADVPSGHWAGAWIERFSQLGHTNGCSASPARFCPDQIINRAEMAVFVQRVFNLAGPPP